MLDNTQKEQSAIFLGESKDYDKARIFEGDTRELKFGWEESKEELKGDSEGSAISHFSRHCELSVIWDAPEEEMRKANRSRKDFVVGVFWILSMVFLCATIGPLILSLPCKSLYVSMVWRNQTGFLIILIYNLYDYWRLHKTHQKSSMYDPNTPSVAWEKAKKDFSLSNIGKSAVMSIFLYVWGLGLLLGCKYTLASHADVLYSSSGVFILLFSIFSCKYVHKYELGGYAIYAIGVAIMLTDPFASKTGEGSDKVFGDGIAFSTALCGAIYGILNTKIQRDYSQTIYMLHFFGIIIIYQLIIGPFLEDNPLYYSFDPEYGIFGWMADWNTFLYLTCFIGPLTTVLSNLSLLMAYKYWPLDVVAIVFLIEPFVAQFTAIMLGQDNLPGIQTLIGISIISAGILIAVYGTKLKSSIKNLPDSNQDEESSAEMSDLT